MAHRMGRTGRTLRRSGAVAAIVAALVAFAGVAAASASAAPLVWTTSASGKSVSTIESSSGKLTGLPILTGELGTTGSQPVSIAITPSGRRAVVVGDEPGEAMVIETATRAVVARSGLPGLSPEGEQVAISPDGETAYITSEGNEDVLVIDPETAKGSDSGLIKLARVGGPATAIAFMPEGEYAYIGVGPEEIKTIYTPSREVVGKPIAVGGVPTSIVFTPDGETAYVTAEGLKGVQVIDTALEEVVKTIPTTAEPSSLAVSPDGKHLYIATEATAVPAAPAMIRTAETATNTIVGKAISVPSGAAEIAISPDGKTAWAAGSQVSRVNLATEKVEAITGTGETSALVVAPDQSPTAAFTPPTAFAGTPAAFSGAASTDPDGTVTSWSWTFGDGGVATGVGPTHAYAAPRTYNAELSVVDNEGCGEEEVFTGRTAYCSGNEGASVVHAVTAKAPPVVSPVVVPSNKFGIGRVVHNRRNGTARMQVRLPSAGFVLLFGKQVHAVTRKSKGAQTMWLTIHARVELNKRLKKILRAPVRIRVTFTPNGGTARTVHRTVVLQRLPRHKHAGKHHRH
jgi:YVTN family beta-propeller protein